MKNQNTESQFEIDENLLIEKSNSYNWQDIDACNKIPSQSLLYNFQPSEDRKVHYNRLRYILQHQQNSQRVFYMTSVILCFNYNNYYALMLRKDSIKHIKLNYEEQMKFISYLLTCNSKQYQLWNYKKQLLAGIQKSYAEIEKLVDKQYQLIDYILTNEDTKNYHAWDYRNWLTRHYKLYTKEIAVTGELIFNWLQEKWTGLLPQNTKVNNMWLQCNSIWSYRFNLLRDIPENSINKAQEIDQQIERVSSFLLKYPSNQCAWNYLSGVFLDWLTKSDDQDKLLDFVKNFPKNQQNRFTHNFILLCGNNIVKKDAIQHLKKIDPTRALYYEYLEPDIKQKQ